jgi:hypothetical protein
MNIDLQGVTPLNRYDAGNPAESQLVSELATEAREYLLSFSWCRAILDVYVGIAIGGIIGIFLVESEPARAGVDGWHWVVVGDVPPAYLVVDDAPTPKDALEIYLDLMQEWVDAVRAGASTADLIPVNAPPTQEYAEMLESRLAFLQSEVLREDN